MGIYEDWIALAYNKQGQTNNATWDAYLPQEQRIYEDLLRSSRKRLTGTVAELSQNYGMSSVNFSGFLDGINEALDKPLDVDNFKQLTDDSQLDLSFSFETLYKKMVEFKADHLYKLKEWDTVFSPERQEELYTEQKRSTTMRKTREPGRNDPCPCGSGLKYKKCCGA
jgi:hypothetical protein